jgi:hypothetical protein
LLSEVSTKPESIELSLPKPIGSWEFNDSLNDSVGVAHAEAHRQAELVNDALVLGNKGYAVTVPLQQTVKAKTLEAWVQLDTLDQRGGGVMTIQTIKGDVFDSIVFAEKSPNQWLAGSNNFQRTESFNGPEEAEASNRPIHVAIVYHEDGEIVGYRDGEIYGKPYQSKGPYEFKKGETVVSFGVRHLPPSDKRMLSGRILRAQLYDKALSSEEIKASASGTSTTISDSQILAALSDTQRAKLEADRVELAGLEKELVALLSKTEEEGEHAKWTDFARAVFTFKEFLFVK